MYSVEQEFAAMHDADTAAERDDWEAEREAEWEAEWEAAQAEDERRQREWQNRTLFFVREHRLDDLRKAMDKLVKRARKAGVDEAGYRIGSIAAVDVRYRKDAFGRAREWLDYKFPVFLDAGEPIKIAGWEFIARLERIGEDCLIHVVPGCEAIIEPRYRDHAYTASVGCNHCNTRRFRKDVFVVRSVETNEQKLVGRTCLREFLGCDTPNKLLAKFEWERAVDGIGESDDWFGGGFGEHDETTMGVLSATATIIRMKGWLSKARCREGDTPTSSEVHTFLFGRDVGKDRSVSEFKAAVRAAHTPEDDAQAERVIAYWMQEQHRAGSEYERNLHILLKQDITRARHFGLVCSAIAAWARAQGVTLGPQKIEREPVNRRWGSDKERLRNVRVTVLAIHSYASRFSESAKIVTFAAEDGSEAKWFTDGCLPFRECQEVMLTGTVHGFEEWKGKWATILKRCKTAGVQ